MRIIKEEPQKWSEVITCKMCGTTFEADENDLETDMFKKRGTHWFDGSAERAGLTREFFVTCPKKCGLHLVTTEIPYLLQQRLIKESQ